jgi:hypothetical protein
MVCWTLGSGRLMVVLHPGERVPVAVPPPVEPPVLEALVVEVAPPEAPAVAVVPVLRPPVVEVEVPPEAPAAAVLLPPSDVALVLPATALLPPLTVLPPAGGRPPVASPPPVPALLVTTLLVPPAPPTALVALEEPPTALVALEEPPPGATPLVEAPVAPACPPVLPVEVELPSEHATVPVRNNAMAEPTIKEANTPVERFMPGNCLAPAGLATQSSNLSWACSMK